MLQSLLSKLAETLKIDRGDMFHGQHDTDIISDPFDVTAGQNEKVKTETRGDGRAVFISDGTEQEYIDEIEDGHKHKIARFLGL